MVAAPATHPRWTYALVAGSHAPSAVPAPPSAVVALEPPPLELAGRFWLVWVHSCWLVLAHGSGLVEAHSSELMEARSSGSAEAHGFGWTEVRKFGSVQVCDPYLSVLAREGADSS